MGYRLNPFFWSPRYCRLEEISTDIESHKFLASRCVTFWRHHGPGVVARTGFWPHDACGPCQWVALSFYPLLVVVCKALLWFEMESISARITSELNVTSVSPDGQDF